MADIKKFIEEKAVDEGFLQDWYIHSVIGGGAPQWTEEHIAEVCGDFYLIPKESVENVENTDDKSVPKRIIPKECLHCTLEQCDSSCNKDFNRCPNCNSILDTDSGEEYKHCPECGQALIW